ncbi:MAG: exonuclease domain-containing protein [Candidatus Omnitrophota bacterium]|nr:exonuclease domain-containing protein [Candidatus Omnitrophota bacterium]
MDKNIEEIEFTIFDTETTGLEPESGDRIVEIAGIRFKGKERIATFETLVNPHRLISAGAFAVNKITPDMLKDAPEIMDVMPKFLDFIRGSCLCSYNATFDLEFLNNELKLMGQNLPSDNAVVDILKMAKRISPALERYSLWFVADSLGIKTKQEHRAFSDVELTLGVFYKLKGMLQTKGISDFTNFLSLFGLNSQFLDEINNQKLAKIQEAIDLGVRLKIKYLSGSDASVTERDVIPKEIRQDKNKSYLVGYCCLRNDERTFRIDGILHIEVV